MYAARTAKRAGVICQGAKAVVVKPKKFLVEAGACLHILDMEAGFEDSGGPFAECGWNLGFGWAGAARSRPFLHQALDGEPRCRGREAGFGEPLDVFGEDIHLEVYGVAHGQRLQVGIGIGEGNDRGLDDGIGDARRR